MMVAVYKQLRLDRDDLGKGNLKDLLKEKTRENCRLSSAMVLAYLEEKYPKMFTTKILIESVDIYGLSLIHGWGWHDYFLAFGKDNCWYAGSPANFGMPDNEERTENLIYSRSLPTVLERIQSVEGGWWPEAKEIYGLVNNGYEDMRVILFDDRGNKAVNLLLASREMTSTNFQRVSVKI